MRMQNHPKGRAFETKVGNLLLSLRSKYPTRVTVLEQPKLVLHDGQEVIPDFDLGFDVFFERGHYLIECQDRKRITPQILQKIKYIKALSPRNRFIFVYPRRLSESTRKALDADGVPHRSFEEFADFVRALDHVLLMLEPSRSKSVFCWPQHKPMLS